MLTERRRNWSPDCTPECVISLWTNHHINFQSQETRSTAPTFIVTSRGHQRTAFKYTTWAWKTGDGQRWFCSRSTVLLWGYRGLLFSDLNVFEPFCGYLFTKVSTVCLINTCPTQLNKLCLPSNKTRQVHMGSSYFIRAVRILCL